jgi:hypothetical protein
MSHTSVLDNPATLPVVAPTYVHIVTLIHRQTGDEQALTVCTLSDRFAVVLREVTHLKAVHKLQGYEVFEVLDCNAPF